MYIARAFSGLGVVYPEPVEREIAECKAAGGYPIVGFTAMDQFGAPDPRSAYVRGCQFPEKPAAQPAPQPAAIVNTAVNTQVSPQISPVFVQQDQPVNSPVQAETTAAPKQIVPYNARSDYADTTPVASDGIDELLKYLRNQPTPEAAPNYTPPGIISDAGGGGSADNAAPFSITPTMMLAAAALFGLIFFARK